MGPSYFYQTLLNVISDGIYPLLNMKQIHFNWNSLTSVIIISTSVTEVSSGNENRPLYYASEEKQLGGYRCEATECLAAVLYDTCAW